MSDINIFNNDYGTVEPTKVLLDTQSGNIRDVNDPFNKILVAAKSMGITVNEPDKKCKECYGKGYRTIRVENGEPVPCLCIFDKKDRQQIFPIKYNREQRRRIERAKDKIIKKLK